MENLSDLSQNKLFELLPDKIEDSEIENAVKDIKIQTNDPDFQIKIDLMLNAVVDELKKEQISNRTTFADLFNVAMRAANRVVSLSNLQNIENKDNKPEENNPDEKSTGDDIDTVTI